MTKCAKKDSAVDTSKYPNNDTNFISTYKRCQLKIIKAAR